MSLVVTKNTVLNVDHETPELRERINATQFNIKLVALKELRDNAMAAVNFATQAILKFALNYHALDVEIDGSTDRRRQLNETMGLNEQQASRLRTIGKYVAERNDDEIVNHFPASFEAIYELVRALKQSDPETEKELKSRIREAAGGRGITLSAARDIRKHVDPIAEEQKQKWDVDDLSALVFEVKCRNVPTTDEVDVLMQHIALVCSSSQVDLVGLNDARDLNTRLGVYWEFQSRRDEVIETLQKAARDESSLFDIELELRRIALNYNGMFRDDILQGYMQQLRATPRQRHEAA